MHKWLLGLGLSTFGIAAFASGCSSTPANPYPDVASFCTAKAKAECSIAPTCAIDPTTCESVRESLCNSDAATAVSTGTREYNSANVQACLNKIETVYKTKEVLQAQLEGAGSIDDLCERVFDGKAKTNEACTSAYDCSGSLICSPVTPGATQMVCATSVAVASGGFCSNPGSVCAASTFCSSAMGAPQCVAAGAMGSICSGTQPCQAALRCLDSTCQPRQPPGGTCSTDADCETTAPYCDPNANFICTVGLTFATGADDCKAYSQLPSSTTPPPVDAGGTTPPADAATGG